MSYLNFLIQISEKDKRLIVALFIALILIFVLIAYIGAGIKALMRKYSKGIDGYMHELCSAKLVTNPRQFYSQVLKRESKYLYSKTRWVLRVFILCTIGFIVYTFIAKPGESDQGAFIYFKEAIEGLMMKFTWPKGEFFGFKKFPIDWPYVSKWPDIQFTIPNIISYVILIVWIFSFFGIFASTLRFIARMNRARVKSKEVFTRSLDDATFIQE